MLCCTHNQLLSKNKKSCMGSCQQFLVWFGLGSFSSIFTIVLCTCHYRGFNNRTVMIRARIRNEKSAYFEYRLPCVASNPYLVLASVVIAGMDGIKNKILPSVEPITDDPHAEKYDGVFEKIPQDLGVALAELQKDELICKGFGDMFIESYVGIKKMEIECFNTLTKQLNNDPIAAEKQMFSAL